MKRKILIRGLVLLFVFFQFIGLAHAGFGYDGDAYSGSKLPITVKPDVTSWWTGMYGIRVTLVDQNGDRPNRSISMDYSNFNNLKGYSYFNVTKKSKLDYQGTSSLNISNLKRGTTANPYVYKKPIVVIPDFLDESASSKIILDYFANNFDYKKNTANALKLLEQLNAPAIYIQNVETSVRCQKLVDQIGASAYADRTTCAVTFASLANAYKYYLIVEPIAYIAIQSGNYWIAATATEAALLLENYTTAGFVRGITHANLPRSIYITKDYFGGKLTALTAANLRSTSYLTRAAMIGTSGYGVGVFWVNDSLENPPVDKPRIIETVVGKCGEDATFKDTEDWDYIKGVSAMRDVTMGNEKYCKVYCRQQVITKFPGEVPKQKAGTHYVFEPFAVSTQKDCRADVALSTWRTNYQTAVTNMINTYNAWQFQKAKADEYNNVVKPLITANSKYVGADVQYIGPCSSVSEWVIDPVKGAVTFGDCSSNNPGKGFLENAEIDYERNDLSSITFTVPATAVISNKTCVMGLAPKGSTSFMYDLSRKIDEDDYDGALIDRGPTIQSDKNTQYTFLKAASSDFASFSRFVRPETTCSDVLVAGDGGNALDDGGWINSKFMLINRGTYCELSKWTTIDTGAKYNWSYDYNGKNYPMTTCGGYSVDADDEWIAYRTARDAVTALENALKTCSSWNMTFKTEPKLILQQTDGGKIIPDQTLQVLDKGIDDPTNTGDFRKEVTNFCTDGGLCTTPITQYSCTGTVCNGSDAIAAFMKPYYFTKVQQTANENFTYSLPTNYNRYVLKDTGKAVTTLPSEYATSGAYTDIGYANIVLGYNADNIDLKGNITIKYSGLGEPRISSGEIIKFPTYNYVVKAGDTVTFDTYVDKKYKGGSNTGPLTYSCDYEYEPGTGITICEGPTCKSCVGPSCKDSKVKLNLVYRPIDLKNPFPAYSGVSRDLGFNWRIQDNYVTDYILNNRGVVGDKVFDTVPMYIIDFTGANKAAINEIKIYNSKNSYNDLGLTCSGVDLNNHNDGAECKSTYLRTKLAKYVTGCGMSTDWHACE